MRRREVAQRRRRVLKLYDAGLTQLEISAQLKMPRANVALDLKMSPGYVPRPTLASYKPAPGRITASEAAKLHGLKKLPTLLAAIDAGVVRGQTVKLGKRTKRTVDPDEFEEDMANLPVCRFEGCAQRALAPSGGCSGPHARALETQGRSWRTPEAIAKTAASQIGKARPDNTHRWTEIHSDPKRHAEVTTKALRGRKNKAGHNITSATIHEWGGRVGGFTPPRPGAQSRGRKGPTEEQIAAVLERLQRVPQPSDSQIGVTVGLTRRQVQHLRTKAAHKTP